MLVPNPVNLAVRHTWQSRNFFLLAESERVLFEERKLNALFLHAERVHVAYCILSAPVKHAN